MEDDFKYYYEDLKKNMEIIMTELSVIKDSLDFNRTVLNLERLSVYTGYSKTKLKRLALKGLIPCYKPVKGENLYFNRFQIDNWLLKYPIELMVDEALKGNLDEFSK